MHTALWSASWPSPSRGLFQYPVLISRIGGTVEDAPSHMYRSFHRTSSRSSRMYSSDSHMRTRERSIRRYLCSPSASRRPTHAHCQFFSMLFGAASAANYAFVQALLVICGRLPSEKLMTATGLGQQRVKEHIISKGSGVWVMSRVLPSVWILFGRCKCAIMRCYTELKSTRSSKLRMQDSLDTHVS